LFTV
jgi:hypothetical protein